MEYGTTAAQVATEASIPSTASVQRQGRTDSCTVMAAAQKYILLAKIFIDNVGRNSAVEGIAL